MRLTYFGVALLEPFLVRDGLLLHEPDVDRPAATLVTVEQSLARFPPCDPVQRFGELDRVVDAAVQAEAPDRIVDVRRVAREEHPALAEGFRHALVHAIDVPVRDQVHGMIFMELPQPSAHRGLRKRLLIRLVLPGRKHRAPAPLQIIAHDLEEIGPLLRVGDVAARAATQRCLEVEQGREHQEALGPGVAFEFDIGAFAHRAAPAVAADHVVEDLPLRTLRRDAGASRVVGEAGHARSEPKLAVRHRGKPSQADLRQLVLLGLDDERVRSFVAQHLVIELRDEADRLQLFEKPQFGEHLERGGVRGRGARAVVDFALRLEEHDLHAFSRTGDRRDDAHRSRADDADPRRHAPGPMGQCGLACPPAAGSASPAARFEWSSASSRYIAGTTKSVNKVPMATPVAITSPMLKRLTAPAPLAIRSGTTPSTIAPVVIRIGRSRIPAAFSTASRLDWPCLCRLLSNSTIRMPCLLMRPMSVTSPTLV